MKKKYILDTSAIISFLEGEEGDLRVKSLLEKAELNTIEIYICFISLIEIYYITFRKSGEDTAAQRLTHILNLPVNLLKNVNEPFIIQSGMFKAKYSISFADSLICSFAYNENAILVHKDPELLSLEGEIQLETLPFKKNNLK